MLYLISSLFVAAMLVLIANESLREDGSGTAGDESESQGP